MFQGKMNGYVCQGFNPLLSFPNRTKLTTALSKLKFLVVMDPLQTETARFWQNHGEYNDVDSASIQTEVIELPTTCFAEDEGRSPTPAAGCNGIGPAPRRRPKPSTTPGSWRSSFCASKRSTRRKAAPIPDPLTPTWCGLTRIPGRSEARRNRQGDQRLRTGRRARTRTTPPRRSCRKASRS